MDKTKLMNYYKGKKVFITGHTGFKGAWLSFILTMAGADIAGYSLEPENSQNLYNMLGLSNHMTSVIADIRNLDKLLEFFNNFKPEVVFHLAAQPIVRKSYQNPIETFSTNVMGTANVLECIRKTKSVYSFVNVTTDKVYDNQEWAWGYRETDRLDGHDPYSNSKSCSELVTHSYVRSFFSDGKGVFVSTARAGNVIGGGDFSQDRIIPDCVRASQSRTPIQVRNPYSVRPYQHVLEPLFAYMLIAQKQPENKEIAGNYNIGPLESDCITTGNLADLFCRFWNNGQFWENLSSQSPQPHETRFLKLDCSKAKHVLGWQPKWNIEKAVQKTVEGYKAILENCKLREVIENQIYEYINEV